MNPTVSECQGVASALRADGMTHRTVARRMAEMLLLRPDGLPWSLAEIRRMVAHVEPRTPIHPSAAIENAKTDQPRSRVRLKESGHAEVVRTIELMLRSVTQGATLAAAASSAGVSRHQFLRWRRWAAEGRAPFAQALLDLTAAQEAGKQCTTDSRAAKRAARAADVRRKHADARMRRYVHVRDPERRGDIYVIVDGVSGRVKVGFASRLAERLLTYRTQAPHLELATSFPGTFQQEREVHAALRGRAVCGREWYPLADCDLVKDTIARITQSAPRQ